MKENQATTLIAQIDVIVVEDEDAVRLATLQTLELGGFKAIGFATAEQALANITADFGGIIVSDVRLPQASGLDLLAQVVTLDADCPIIMMTGHGHIEMAVEAMRQGAYDFIEKPFSSERLIASVKRAHEKRRLVIENRRLKQAWTLHPDLPPLIGQSLSIEQLRKQISMLGSVTVDVLINGETGTGKEVVARHLHAASACKGPFVAINCGALPEAIFESEIFGHEAGAFTNAQKKRIGKLEFADQGTVFLDEIESMPIALQIKMLRVLQEREIERIGSNQIIPLNCRVIAATKENLLELSQKGLFRADLYYRLNAVQISLPPLRQRRDDTPLLLAQFFQFAAQKFSRPLPAWSAQQMQTWQAQDWPGNVRELAHFADRYVLGLESGDATNQAPKSALSLVEAIDQFEREMIQKTYDTHDGNVAETALALNMPKKTLYDKLKKYQINASAENSKLADRPML